MTKAIGFADELYVGSREREALRILLVFSPEKLTEKRKGKCRMVERNQEFFLDV